MTSLSQIILDTLECSGECNSFWDHLKDELISLSHNEKKLPKEMSEILFTESVIILPTTRKEVLSRFRKDLGFSSGMLCKNSEIKYFSVSFTHSLNEKEKNDFILFIRVYVTFNNVKKFQYCFSTSKKSEYKTIIVVSDYLSQKFLREINSIEKALDILRERNDSLSIKDASTFVSTSLDLWSEPLRGIDLWSEPLRGIDILMLRECLLENTLKLYRKILS